MIIRNKFNGYINGNNRLYPGGGGQPSTPASQTVSQTTIPEYARPYMEKMLGKAEAFSETPYQAYGGQRQADFTPLQQQAFQGAADLGPSQQGQLGSRFAGAAGLGSLQAGQNYQNMATDPNAMKSYMSPYIQNALNPMMDEARRQSDISGQQNAAQAASAGAFGGSRFGIQESERQRNLGQNQAQIYGQGMQNAFNNAQQAQQFGANLGLQGYGQANQSANILGQLGQQEFAQKQGAIQAQAAAGSQQQNQEQQRLTQQYQDFLTQRGYPQQQIAFMSDILRGAPMSQQTQTQYTAPPSMGAQLGQLGLGAYGVSQLFKKKGGVIKMAEGGITGNSAGVDINKLQGMVSQMSPQQLDQVKANTKDVVTLSIINEQEALNQRMKNSMLLANALPKDTIKDEMVARGRGIDEASQNDFGDTAVGENETSQEPEMARGGIVAFAGGSKKAVQADDMGPPKPQPLTYEQQLAQMDMSAPAMTEEERTAARQKAMQERENVLGANPNDELMKQYTGLLGKEIPQNERNAMMAFKAMGILGKPGQSLATSVGEAAAGAAGDMMEYRKEEKKNKQLLLQAQMDYNKAGRAEKAGNYDLAQKYVDSAEAKQEAAKSRQASRLEKLSGYDVEREKMGNQKEVARISAGPGWASANKQDFNVQALNSTIEGKVAAFTEATGRAPNKNEMAKIKETSVKEVAPLVHPAYNPLGQEGNLAVKQANEANDRIKQIESALKAHKLGVTPLTPAQVASLEREMEQQRAVVARGTGANNAPKPNQLTGKDKEALDWANANPRDPRAAAIKQRLGVN